MPNFVRMRTPHGWTGSEGLAVAEPLSIVRIDVNVKPYFNLHTIGVFNADITLSRRYPSGFSRGADVAAVVQINFNHQAVTLQHFEFNVFYRYGLLLHGSTNQASVPASQKWPPDLGHWHCQTNLIGPVEPTTKDAQAASLRHSAKAAERLSLKVARL